MDGYNDFIKRFNVRHVRALRYRDALDYDYYKQNSSYYDNRDELIEMELSRSGFEQLVQIDHEYTRLWQDQRDEAWFRKQNPAIAEAYDKYRMLLELYR
jgi:hypothetical protein